MWQDDFKKAGVSVHVIATGAGAGLQQLLWEIPGSSAYLSGASFPYDQSETEELLGFKPTDSFCSEEMAIDLASAAYMKAYKFGGKKPIGLGLTASVASEKVHRGDHRYHVCLITDDKSETGHDTLNKGVGQSDRENDGYRIDSDCFLLLRRNIAPDSNGANPPPTEDATAKARARFFAHPYFLPSGQRERTIADARKGRIALMPGAYNPPHEGHHGMAEAYEKLVYAHVVYNVCATPPHKDMLSVQDLLKRAKLLRGKDVLFSQGDPFYLDKARLYPNTPMLLGADAMVRLLDPKWGMEITPMLEEFDSLNTRFAIAGRTVNGKYTTVLDIIDSLTLDQRARFDHLFDEIPGKWDVSSTEIRNKVLNG